MPAPTSATTLRELLALACEEATAWREAEGTTPVAAAESYEQLHTKLNTGLTDQGVDSETVVRQLIAAARGGLHNVTGGRFFGWVMGGSLPSALAADWLTSAWDQNAGAFAVAPAASVVEEIAGGWLRELLGLPREASFALVTGCQMAHATCLAAARHHLLAQRGWDVEQQGLFGAPRLRILTSTEVHGTVGRAARLLGLGEACIEKLPCDERGGLRSEALEAALAEAPEAPTIVLLQAADLHRGAFDAFPSLIPIARRSNAWVHVDGAFGLWVAASPRFRHLAEGVELADSWATDGHKWLNVPYDCGYAFVRHPEAQRGAFAYHATYVPGDEAARDPLDWTPEWSRRARGFATYAALRELGRSGVAGIVERCCDRAHDLVSGLAAIEGVELLWMPVSNQGIVRFLHPTPQSEADHDAFTDRVTAAIATDGEALFSNTTWLGARAMRVSVCNWQTSPQDIERVIRSVRSVLAPLRAETLR